MEAMLAGTPTGLYGHVEENRKRSILLFGGFMIAIQLMALIALMLLTLSFDQAHNPLVSPLGYAKRYMLPVAVFAMLAYAAQLWWFVGGVKKAVGFRYVDHADEPRFCRILEPLTIAAGIATPFAAVIDSPARNAFACGVRANHMVVVATRGLIDSLDDDELGAVLAHEVMHIKNKDTMLLASANTFMATLMLAQGFRRLKFDDWRQMIGMVLMPVLIPIYLLMSFLTQIALRIGYSSRAAIGSAREMIADAEAVRLTKNPAALVSALRKIEGNSRIESLGVAEEAMMIDGATAGPLATHPTIDERIAALARTTGSMIFTGGTRLDTRDPGLTGAAAVPLDRNADDLLRVAALAEAPSGGSMWAIFRKVRDPQRNILGFDRRSALHFGLVLAGVAVFAQTTIGARSYAAQRDLFGLAREAGDVQKLMLACDLEAIGFNPTGVACDTKALEAKSAALGARMGTPDTETPFREEQRQRAATMLARRCFNGRHTMTPAALAGPPQGRNRNGTRYSMAALASVEPILQMAPGPARDLAIKDYVDFRKLMIENALYYGGRSELDALNANYHRDDHQRVIALLGERLRDPAFTGGTTLQADSKLRLFATAPFEALPCDVVAELAPAPKG
jgi:Zn-dependent protease with chaperone function